MAYTFTDGVIMGTTTVYAPVTYDASPSIPATGKALGTFMRFGTAGDGDPVSIGAASNASVGEYMYLPSSVVGSSTGQGLWCYNPVLNILSSSPDVGASLIEVDLENGKADPSTVPFTSYPSGYSKTGVTAVIGPSSYDSTAAFACIVNFSANNKGWLYGYWAGGVRTASFHAERWSPYVGTGGTSGGYWDPDVAFSNATHATTLLKSTGSHSTVIDAPNIHIYDAGTAANPPVSGFTVVGDGRLQGSTASDGVLALFYTGANSANTAVSLYRGTSAKGSITTDASGAYYNSISDARLKADVQPLQGGLALVNSLRPVTYVMKNETGPRHSGLIAQDLLQVVPELVFGDPNGLDENGNVLPLQVDYAKLIPVLIAAIQELAANP